MVRLAYTSTFTADVGTGGFCIQAMKVLPASTPLVGAIEVEGMALPFAGRVAWTKPGDRGLGLAGRMGVTFTRISPDFPRLLDLSAAGEGRGRRTGSG